MRTTTIILLLLFAVEVSAQYDTNYVVRYPDRLVISSFQSYRLHELLITQSNLPDTGKLSTMDYVAQGANSTGLGLDWDKISFSIGWRSPGKETDEHRKGHTHTRNIAFSLNAKKIRFETSFRDYRGFYDQSIAKYLPAFNDTTPYYQNPDMGIKTWRIKGIYFMNRKKRFSYAAAYANTQRQIKSAGAFVFVSNLYHQRMYSPLGFVEPVQADSFYQDYNDWNSFNVTGLSFAPGFSFNIVLFKRLFGNFTFDWGVELQRRSYSSADNHPNREDWKVSLASGDARASLGYNGKNFFIYSFFIGDYNIFLIEKVKLEKRLISGGVTLGYRFKFKENKVTHFIKNNRIYKMI